MISCSEIPLPSPPAPALRLDLVPPVVIPTEIVRDPGRRSDRRFDGCDGDHGRRRGHRSLPRVLFPRANPVALVVPRGTLSAGPTEQTSGHPFKRGILECQLGPLGPNPSRLGRLPLERLVRRAGVVLPVRPGWTFIRTRRRWRRGDDRRRSRGDG